ncbi:MAG: type III-B CRISPR module RAMP protein Cmr6 [Bryobacteraceae bacterium]|nr:type III-B CRISPR module RAMP protein Cmr6 [Bryobacteraceae bacterium]
MSASGICPLYGARTSFRNNGHAGLYYDKFFDRWRRLDTHWSRDGDGDQNPKQDWLEEIAKAKAGDPDLLREYCRRIAQLAWRRQGAAWVFKTEERFLTGTGRSHPVENGFAWHPILGVPYLPGSSIKGLIGQRDREGVLGSQTCVGDVIFLDAIPIGPVDLEADVMTPHYLPWDAGNPPGDWRSPTPIPFLTTTPGALFLFAVLPRTENNVDSVQKIQHWLEQALADIGAGAKTAVGYGRMKRAAGADAQWLTDFKREAARVRDERIERERLSQMDPLDRELTEIAASSRDPNLKHWIMWLRELQRGRWTHSEQVRSVAKRIQAAMEKDGSWRPQTRSKNPAKDHAYQTTLSVMKHLG